MRILILGTGAAQADLIEYCKRNGHYVVGCSYTDKDKWNAYTDIFEIADIKDKDAVFAIAEKYNVDLVYSVGSAVAMPTVMEVSEKLGLPHFVPAETVGICLSKNRLRECLGPEAEGNISFGVYAEPEDALTYDEFPAMMKPVDSQGQRGCFRIESKEDIRKYFELSREQSSSGRVIIEEFIEGSEVSVNAYMHDGNPDVCLISDRISYDRYPGGIIKEHRIPSIAAADSSTEEKIRKLVENTAKKLGILNGPAYFQIMLRDDTEPVLIEADARLDGCHLWRLIRSYCGIDLIDMTFRHLMYNEYTKPEIITRQDQGYSLTFINREPGEVFSREGIDTADAEYVCFYYDEGDIVRKKNGHYEKCGYIIRKI